MMAPSAGGKRTAAEKLEEEIADLAAQNRALLEELRRQNEYDLSQGRQPGKFREHFTLSCIEANKRSIEQLDKALARAGGPTRQSAAPPAKRPERGRAGGILGAVMSPLAYLFSRGERVRRSVSLPHNYTYAREPEDACGSVRSDDDRRKARGGGKPKYSKPTQERILKLESEIAELVRQNVYLMGELRTYTDYDLSQGRQPGKFRERMTLSLVDTNKKGIEQLEAVLAKLKKSRGKGLLLSLFG